jgi:hypothetical protein
MAGSKSTSPNMGTYLQGGKGGWGGRVRWEAGGEWQAWDVFERQQRALAAVSQQQLQHARRHRESGDLLQRQSGLQALTCLASAAAGGLRGPSAGAPGWHPGQR